MTREDLVKLPIAEVIPLAKPMSLLDRSISMTEEAFETEVTIRPDSLFCDGEKVGAWVGMEYMAQTVGVFANSESLLKGQPINSGFLLGSREYLSKVPAFKVGSVLRVSAKKLFGEGSSIGVLECSLREAGSPETLAEANLKLFEVPDIQKFLEENT